jgi:hypothetical protein
MGTSRLSRYPAHARHTPGLIVLAALLFTLFATAPTHGQAPTRPATVAPPTTTPTPTAGTALREPTASASPESPISTAEATAESTPEPICPGAPPTRLIPGERGRVSIDDPRPLNIRSGPGTSNEVIGQIPARGIFFVIEGPRCSQRYAWYRIAYREGESDEDVITGWIAEGDLNGYFVEVYPPGW